MSVDNGTTKWEQPFDALLSDVFEVQGRIAEQVAQALDVKLGTSLKATLEQRPTQNLAAYDAFLRGEAASAQDDPMSFRHAISYYEQAVALDSTFVQAWAELARAQALLYANGTPTPAGAEAARRAAERTLALAPNRSEGHRALGLYYSTVITDLPRALAEANTALELAPGSARALALVGYIETNLGRWEAEGGRHRPRGLYGDVQRSHVGARRCPTSAAPPPRTTRVRRGPGRVGDRARPDVRPAR